jgi:transposase
VVVDHDRQRLIWARGRDERTLLQFFDELGAERYAAITHASADAASWIANVVTARCPQAIQCLDPSTNFTKPIVAYRSRRRGKAHLRLSCLSQYRARSSELAL